MPTPDIGNAESAAMEPAARHAGLQEQFEDAGQQRSAAELGMWIFLATELLFFGGLFTLYIIYREIHFEEFKQGSHLLEAGFGLAMTALLVTSSFTMAMAVRSAQIGKRKPLVAFLLVTMLFGGAFLGLKFTEYHVKWTEQLVPGLRFSPGGERLQGARWQGVEMFMCFYFFMTGLHALHMIVGIGLLGVLAILSCKGRYTEGHFTPIENAGLYWHFVDIVWLFLFPLLYLVRGA